MKEEGKFGHAVLSCFSGQSFAWHGQQEGGEEEQEVVVEVKKMEESDFWGVWDFGVWELQVICRSRGVWKTD